ncbi:O-antigen ligase family protein [Fictibacillus sp. NPDC058756]|uniref:O-antigen ligase family protein n=1 Tax=Fictibacillus sp. NPDC058756 TaxID=3346625 RepID=UPI0036B3E6FC
MYTLQTNNINNKFYLLLIVFIAIFLNQSTIINGANISFADLFCVITLLFLLLNNKLLFPIKPTLFFLLLSVIILFTSTFYVPVAFEYYPSTGNIFINYLKLLIIFSYFIVGYNVPNHYYMEKTVKWYSLTALAIGTLGILLTTLNINFLTETLFLGTTRFKGLMNDPNYYAIIQVSAIAYFSRTKNAGKLMSKIAVFFIILSIFISGSKTGFITVFCYFIFRLVENIFKARKKINKIIINISLLIPILLIVIYAVFNLNSLLETIANIFPAFSRVQQLLIDFDNSVSENGSSRNSAWMAAIEIIKLSPIIGIGIGTYLGISEKMFNINVIAHNTYLQLFTEWGIVLSTILFMYIFFLIGKITFKKNIGTELNCTLRDILIVFLIGSLAISLNNARMVWFFLGMLLISLKAADKRVKRP